MSEKINILYAEDEEALGMIVCDSLESRGFAVDFHSNGKTALEAYYKDKHDILVLDIMMPKMDGFTLAREVRKTNKNVPIIFLTAKSLTTDVVEGFELGGNDYLKKPFSMEELIVRVKALLGRNIINDEPEKRDTHHDIGMYKFETTSQILECNGTERQLTHRESELLRLLCENKNKVLNRKATLLDLWDDDNFFNARSMDVFITKLRKYLKEDPNVQIINIRTVGYKMIIKE